MAVSLSLPERLEDKVEKAVEKGYYSSKSGFMREAIREKADSIAGLEPGEGKLEAINKNEDQSYYYSTAQDHIFLFGRTDVPTDAYIYPSHAESMSLNELENMIAELAERYQFEEGDAMFGVSQMNHSWFGKGAKEFISTIRDREQRYEDAKDLHKHHTELGLIRMRVWDGLYISISADISATHDVESLDRVTVRLAYNGLPFDNRSILDFFDKYSISFRSGMHMEGKELGYHNFKERGVSGIHQARMQKEREEVIELEIVEELPPRDVRYKDRDEDWVANLMVKNPYYQNTELFEKHFGDVSKTSITGRIIQLEHLYCSLNQYYKKHENPDYKLVNMNIADTTNLAGRNSTTIQAEATHIEDSLNQR